MAAGDMDGLVSMLAADAVVVNGQPGALFLAADGRLISVMALEIEDGRVVGARSVINRDKLRHLGPLADLPGLLEQARSAGLRRTTRPGDSPVT